MQQLFMSLIISHLFWRVRFGYKAKGRLGWWRKLRKRNEVFWGSKRDRCLSRQAEPRRGTRNQRCFRITSESTNRFQETRCCLARQYGCLLACFGPYVSDYVLRKNRITSVEYVLLRLHDELIKPRAFNSFLDGLVGFLADDSCSNSGVLERS